MPIIRSAIKKMRKDRLRTARNRVIRTRIKSVIAAHRATPSAENLAHAMSVLDRAAKRHVIHRNTSARLKSRLAHLRSPKTKHTSS